MYFSYSLITPIIFLVWLFELLFIAFFIARREIVGFSPSNRYLEIYVVTLLDKFQSLNHISFSIDEIETTLDIREITNLEGDFNLISYRNPSQKLLTKLFLSNRVKLPINSMIGIKINSSTTKFSLRYRKMDNYWNFQSPERLYILFKK